MFSALSAEAYINTFLAGRMSAADFDRIDRLRTEDKYVFGPRVAIGERLFDRGAEPAQSIGVLFTLRHQLVHPKGKRIRMDKGTLADPRFEKFNPGAAAVFVVRVAEAAKLLADQDARKPDAVVTGILDERANWLALGESLRDRVPAIPHKSRFRPARRKPAPVEGAVPRDVIALVDRLATSPYTATGPLPPVDLPDRESK